MTTATAKRHLRAMLADLTTGSVLHLLSEVLAEAHAAAPDNSRDEQVEAAVMTLFVVGLGIDAILPQT